MHRGFPTLRGDIPADGRRESADATKSVASADIFRITRPAGLSSGSRILKAPAGRFWSRQRWLRVFDLFQIKSSELMNIK
jgi:hypothetical protein